MKWFKLMCCFHFCRDRGLTQGNWKNDGVFTWVREEHCYKPCQFLKPDWAQFWVTSEYDTVARPSLDAAFQSLQVRRSLSSHSPWPLPRPPVSCRESLLPHCLIEQAPIQFSYLPMMAQVHYPSLLPPDEFCNELKMT